MHYALSMPTRAPWPVVSVQANASHGASDEHVHRDPRWQSLVARLELLRRRGRHAVRIVDVNCGDGELLIEAVRRARVLGFLAIEALGTDRALDSVDEARWSRRFLADSAIGLDFDVAEPLARLEAEAEFPADIVLYEAPDNVPQGLRDAVRHAGDLALRGNPSSRVERR